jgi:peptide/nickel transport system permease protein
MTDTAFVTPLTTPKKKKRFNRFDSPWLNSHLIIGAVIIIGILLFGLLGPLFWDMNKVYVGSSPLNLPPAWIQRATPTPAPTPEATATEKASGFGSSGLGGSGILDLMQSTPDPNRNTPQDVGPGLPSGNPAYPLGTDNQGRDMLALLISGAPSSLKVGFIAAAVGMVLGVILGFSAGFLGGWVDAVIRTAADVMFTIPVLAVLFVIAAFIKRLELEQMAFLLALFSWPAPTRFIRAQALSLRERGYVKMAQLSGMSTLSIMFREMMPNLLPYLASSFVGNLSGAILAEASLEALGLGPTRIPTLGMTINYAIRGAAILQNMWWWWGFPIIVLILIFTALFQIAIGLDEVANPRLRGLNT